MTEFKSKVIIYKIMLKSFMINAGGHAFNNMASDGEESWKSVFSAKKYQVITDFKGLGSSDAFAWVFLNHIGDEVKEAGISLL